MTNIELINKIINGTEAQEITITHNEEDYNFTMRPLTDGEMSKLQEMENKAVTVSMQMREDTSKTTSNSKLSNSEYIKSLNLVKTQAVAWSLSVKGENPIKPVLVESLPKGLPDKLFEEVIRISSISEEELKTIKRFRQD